MAWCPHFYPQSASNASSQRHMLALLPLDRGGGFADSNSAVEFVGARADTNTDGVQLGLHCMGTYDRKESRTACTEGNV